MTKEKLYPSRPRCRRRHHLSNTVFVRNTAFYFAHRL